MRTDPCRKSGACSRAVLLVLLVGWVQILNAQTTVLFEGFEGGFPNANGWSVDDADLEGVRAYWAAVDTDFGGAGVHAGSRKGYCAGFGYDGDYRGPMYRDFMTSYMSRTLDLSRYGSAQLEFWHKIPSLEERYDVCRVYLDANVIWSLSKVVPSWTNVTLALPVGGTHTLRFEFASDQSNVGEGWYLDDITVTATPPPPANDPFANAAVLSGVSGTTSDTTLYATKEPGEPAHHGNAGGASVWFRWQAPASGTVTFNTAGSVFDTLLAVYTGASLDALAPVASSDDVPGAQISAVTFEAVAGVEYRLAVDGYNWGSGPAKGAYSLAWLYPVVDELVQSLGVVNYTETVIDSDPADRANIAVSSTVRSANSSAAGHFTTYVLSYRLLDGAGQPHPIYDASGVVNGTNTCNVTNTLFVSASGSVASTTSAALRPAARLDPYQQYAVELRIFRRGAPTGVSATDVPHTYYHYTNLTSGDTALNVIPIHLPPTFTRSYAVQTMPGRQTFLVNANFILLRYDDFQAPPASHDAPVFFRYELRNTADNALIPLRSNEASFVHSVPTYDAGTPNTPYSLWLQDTLEIEPLTQLDPLRTTYRLTVAMSCGNGPRQPALTAPSCPSLDTRLLHFNGRLDFGAIQTTFSSLANAPAVEGLDPAFVATTLAVNNSAGFATGWPSHTYGNGTSLQVRLRPDGHAEVSAGSVTLGGPVPDTAAAAGVRFQRGPIALNSAGGTCSFTVMLPAGFGYRLGDTATGLLEGLLEFAGLPLSQSLTPNSNPSYAPGGTIYCAEETVPVWFQTARITWQVAAGKFTFPASGAAYVRGDEYQYLNSAVNWLVQPGAALKRSNERYYEFVNDLASGVEVATDPNGAARLSCDLSLANGSFQTHFPYDVLVQWGAGRVKMVDGLVDSALSRLDQVPLVTVPYQRECAGCIGTLGPGTPAINPDGAQLHFTRDGGLAGWGPFPNPVPLTWGYFTDPLPAFAQTAYLFTEARFHMPGVCLRGDQTGLAESNRPAVLLYTGVVATNLNVLERPDLPDTLGQTNYLKGLADYAGLNFFSDTHGLRKARSYLGGTNSGEYTLTDRSKYYVRASGVSGIHEAVPGTFPSNLVIYGYPFTFENYGLSYLCNTNHESRTSGAIYVGGPSDFWQQFEELMFNCVGGLVDAKVPENDTWKLLQYWNGDFLTHGITFNSTNACVPTGGKLILNVETIPAHLNKPLFGDLGFEPNGFMIPRSAGRAGVDSRLKLPNTLRLKGPGAEEYAFTPVSDAYYNNFTNTVRVGFITLAGTMDVPFFEDLKVHLQTSAKSNDLAGNNLTAPIYLMGGWPRAGSTPKSKGWEIGNSNFFTVPFFDDHNLGFPTDLDVASYRESANDDYHPRAQRNWLGVVDLDYPLKWSAASRAFTSLHELGDNFAVVSVKHQIKYLSAKHAELRFGAEAGLPQLNLVNLAFDAIEQNTGVLNILKTFMAAPGGPFGSSDHFVLNNGLSSLDTMLADKMHDFYRPVFDDQCNPAIAFFYNSLPPYGSSLTPAAYRARVTDVAQQIIQGSPSLPSSSSLRDSLQNLIIGQGATNVVKVLESKLLDAEDTIRVALQIVAKNDNGDRQVAANLVKGLFEQWPSFMSGPLSGAFNNALKAVMKSYEPTFGQLVITLEGLQRQLGGLRSNLLSADGLGLELAAHLASPAGQTQLGIITAGVFQDITNYFNQFDFAVDNPQSRGDEIKAMVRRSLEDRFFASSLAADLQSIIRHRLYDPDSALREALDTTFQTINNALREQFSEWATMADDALNKWLGNLVGVAASARIRGYAHITDDSLKELRLDMRARLAISKLANLEFNAYFRILELDSSGTKGCPNLGPGETVTEVSLGAEKVALGWLGSTNLAVTIGAKFTFDPNGPRGVAGKFSLDGKANFQALQINSFAAALAMGADETYLSAAASVTFQGVTGAGGFFFGHTCTLEPIRLWDPDVATLMGEGPSFTGAYGYIEAWVPVFGGSCVFQLSVGMGFGTGFFAEGPTLIGKMLLGVGGDFICIISLRADCTLIGVVHGFDLSYMGIVRLHGHIGWCPFCIPFSLGMDVGYYDGGWHFGKR